MTKPLATTAPSLDQVTHIRWDSAERTFVWFSQDGGRAPLPVGQMLAILNEAMAAGYGAGGAEPPMEEPYDVFFGGVGWYSAENITGLPAAVHDPRGRELVLRRHPDKCEASPTLILTAIDFPADRIACTSADIIAHACLPHPDRLHERLRNPRVLRAWDWSGPQPHEGTVLFYRFSD